MASETRAQWGSRLGFILAASGSAIGLGNIWKFPYEAGENGGGAFVLIYIACACAVGMPMMIAELYLGQKSQRDVVTAFQVLDHKRSSWQIIGWMGLIAAILILSFYSVVGGWILDFQAKSLMLEFSGASSSSIKSMFGSLLANPFSQFFWHTVFMALTLGIVLGGVKDGLERWSKILMPALFILLFLLLIRVGFLDGFGQGLKFLFEPKFENLSKEGVLEAVGQSFFSLSLGMGTLLTYGSYLSPKENLPRIAAAVIFMDTLIALIAGIIIFAIVFTFGMEPGSGPGLIFSTLPVLFSQIEGGSILAIAFFLLVCLAALTSSVSLLEVVVAFWVQKTDEAHRKIITIGSALVIYLIGVLSVLSNNVLADFKIFGMTFFDLFDKVTSSYMLPIGGLLISLFFGWKLGGAAINQVVDGKIARLFLAITVKVLAPIGVFFVILQNFVEF